MILVMVVGALVGALTGRRIWQDKDRTPWHGAVIGAALVGTLTLIGLGILLVIWTAWHPANDTERS